MSHDFDPGYAAAPFAGLVADYPGEAVYPVRDFRVEWGPVFHRGRLDGSARILVVGQDPAQHEAISRRILVGEAGQRVQGLLARIGVTRSYVMVNTFLYSVYGQGGGERHKSDAGIAAYRNAWLDALLVGTQVEAVITLGALARGAYEGWATSQPARAATLHHAAVLHPTFPEGASGVGGPEWVMNTGLLLKSWNAALPGLRAAVTPDVVVPAKSYGKGWRTGDLVEIPEADLPAGCPSWMRSLDKWATRSGANASEKRATISVKIPVSQRPWVTP
ncbi:MAG TPA: uracil-DNA glycosylase family protein [Dermatophilaceae bacterium]|nr:uracil-DNA glycosylase family protein [Dermatophilaceae bacterium]